jgi:hypothetical protein
MTVDYHEDRGGQLHMFGRVEAFCNFCENYVLVDDLIGCEVTCDFCDREDTLWVGMNSGAFRRMIGPL